MEDHSGKLLIVDDNEEFILAMKLLLSSYFKEVSFESNPEKIIYLVENHSFDLVLLDMNFKAGLHSGNEGIYWMNKIHEIDPGLRIVFITGYGDIGLAVDSMKKGASDFIEKSWEERKILSTILANYRLSRSLNEVRKKREQQDSLSESIFSNHNICYGSSSRMQKVKELIEKIAATEANILITGESGTGKEVVALEIHRLSGRSKEIFMSVDLGSIPATLFESELFGYARGAFTDAVHEKAGKAEIASGGTLFLDEIGNLSLPLQAKLLGVLQQKVVTRLGETKPRTVDFRLISATNSPLSEMIEQKLFREDLLYRLNTVEIRVPPLRERLEDIPELAGNFIDFFSTKYNKPVITIEATAIKLLQEYHWPGNVRELQHQVEKAIIMSDSGKLTADNFDLGTKMDSRKRIETLNLEHNEKLLILKAIEKCSGNLTRTAMELGINRSTLYEKIKKYEIKPI
jgi:two-component system response regulator HydG